MPDFFTDRIVGTMEHLNHVLFLLLNASPDASSAMVDVARVLADGLIWIVPVGLISVWLRGSSPMRHISLAAMVSGWVGLLVNQLIGLFLYQPPTARGGNRPDADFACAGYFVPERSSDIDLGSAWLSLWQKHPVIAPLMRKLLPLLGDFFRFDPPGLGATMKHREWRAC